MKKRVSSVLKNTSGQDLFEFALLAGFMAVTIGAIMPGVAASVGSIFSQAHSVMVSADESGSGVSVSSAGISLGTAAGSGAPAGD